MAMTLRLTNEESDMLGRIAARRGLSRQKVILELVREEDRRHAPSTNPFATLGRISSPIPSSEALRDERNDA